MCFCILGILQAHASTETVQFNHCTWKNTVVIKEFIDLHIQNDYCSRSKKWKKSTEKVTHRRWKKRLRLTHVWMWMLWMLLQIAMNSLTQANRVTFFVLLFTVCFTLSLFCCVCVHSPIDSRYVKFFFYNNKTHSIGMWDGTHMCILNQAKQ